MMKPALFQILSRALWVLIILVSTGACIASSRQERRLKWPTIYLGYCAAAGSIQFIIWIFYSQASSWFWFFEIINSIGIFIVALELLHSLFSKLVLLLSVGCATVVAFLTIDLLQRDSTTTNWEVNLKTLLMVGVLLTAFVFPHDKWTRESKFIFWGLISLVALSWISSWLWFKSKLGITGVFFSQLSPLPGLLCFAFAHEKATTDSGPALEIGFIYPDEIPKFKNKLNKKTVILVLRQVLYRHLFQ